MQSNTAQVMTVETAEYMWTRKYRDFTLRVQYFCSSWHNRADVLDPCFLEAQGHKESERYDPNYKSDILLEEKSKAS